MKIFLAFFIILGEDGGVGSPISDGISDIVSVVETGLELLVGEGISKSATEFEFATPTEGERGKYFVFSYRTILSRRLT